MESKFALRVIGIVVLLPTTLVASFWTFMGVPALIDSVTHPNTVYPYRALLLAPLLSAGWFGIITLWRLYSHFDANLDLGNIKIHWTGLVAGCLASAALLLAMPGQLLAAWPLIAALYFGWRLRASRLAA